MKNENPLSHHRPVRSYVLRTGRLTQSQKSALDTLWDHYGINIPPPTPLTQETLFNRNSQWVLEIGFGMGTSLLEMALNNPAIDYIGIEVHTPGLGNLLKLIQDANLTNLKIINHDATEVLNQYIEPNSLDSIQIYFPDPWPKKKHHKRRIIQPQFIADLSTRLKPNGTIHLATDWEDYAQHMAEVMEAEPTLSTINKHQSPYSPRPSSRPMTKFETRGIKLGHGVWDLIYKKLSVDSTAS